MKKPSAAARTIDLFAQRGSTDKATEDTEDLAPAVTERPPAETIEQAADRWRNNAIFTAEHFSKNYNSGAPGTDKYRLTENGEHMFLEKFEIGRDGLAYHWAGLMFRRDSLYELTSVFVRAAKARKEKENGE